MVRMGTQWDIFGDDFADLWKAEFSACGRYRYYLTRIWSLDSDRGSIVWIALNPSTADAVKNDPTVTRMMNFSRAWGYGGMWLLNIFALRSTDPGGLRPVSDPIGPENDYWIKTVAGHESLDVVCAWGVHGEYLNRGDEVRAMLADRGKPLSVLGLTKHGYPKHPLYLSSSTPMQTWTR